MNFEDAKIAVAIPCYNEEKSIKKVINGFQKELPGAKIVVFDNNSTDRTQKIAVAEGAKIIHEKRQGKGWVVRSICERLDADIYVMVDGDDTYPAEEVHKLIAPILNDEADMVVGNRLGQDNHNSIRHLHQFGNWCITGTLNLIFRADYKDVLSGYRAFTKDVAKNIPLITVGFEIETEFALQALEHGYIVKEVPIRYGSRPQGSLSKLSSFSDGYRIMVTMAMLLRDHKPHHFFTFIFVILGACSSSLLIYAYTLTTLLNVFLIIGIILGIAAFLFLVTGLILSAVNTRFAELSAIIRKNNYFAVSKEKEL